MSKHYHPIQDRKIVRSVVLAERPIYPTWVCDNDQCAPPVDNYNYNYSTETYNYSTETK